jgi:methanethiol oxidase
MGTPGPRQSLGLAMPRMPAAGGGLSVDERFFPRGTEWRGLRVHQVRLQGGDASSDSYCDRS